MEQLRVDVATSTVFSYEAYIIFLLIDTVQLAADQRGYRK